MSDNLSLRFPADSSRISLKEKWEIKYWTRKFNCSIEALVNAIKAVGNSVENVKQYFNGGQRA